MDLSSLIATRGCYKGLITKMNQQLSNGTLTDFPGTLEKIGSYNEKISNLNAEIATQVDRSNLESEVLSACEFYESFVDFRRKLESKLQDISDTMSVTSSNSSRNIAKLPKLELPKFGGDPLEWTSFWESFDSSVHSNDELKRVEKFNYLKGLLFDRASNTLAGLAVTSANYPQAISLLTSRYGQKQIVVKAHIEALLDVPHATWKNLRETFDASERHIRSLEGLGISADTYGIMMAPMLLKKFPKEIQLLVSRKQGESIWDLQQLRDGLNFEIEARERCFDVPESSRKVQMFDNPNQRSTLNTFVTKFGKPCVYCTEDHPTSRCTQLTLSERFEFVKKRKLCIVCLRPDHVAKDCRFYSAKCSGCFGSGHHISLCNTLNQKPVTPPKDPNCPTTSTLMNVSRKQALMQTAVANVNVKGKLVPIRLVIDNGSQSTFITNSAVRKLGLKPERSEAVRILKFEDYNAIDRKLKVVDLQLVSRYGQNIVPISALVTGHIGSNIESAPDNVFQQPEFINLQFADIPTNMMDVDLLIGQDHLWEFVENGIIRSSLGPVAQNTTFGWIISGSINDVKNSTNAMFVGRLAVQPSLESFWSLEAIGITDNDVDDSLNDPHGVLEHFNRNLVKRAGRYEVCFPWKDSTEVIPSNKNLSLRRFKSLLRRLSNDPLLAKEYDLLIQDQLRRGFIEPVNEDDSKPGRMHYIPHHPVIKTNSATTKIRIVYDASSHERDKLSLNQMLHKGPDLMGNIFGILLRFRMKRIGLVSDIEKAFLQVSLKDSDRNVTRFFWVDNIDDPCNAIIVTYRFTCVPFGVISSPFLLNATIKHHLTTKDDPLALMLQESLYVDNSVISVNTVSEANQFYTYSKQTMNDAGMNLREWTSNAKNRIGPIPTDDEAKGNCEKVLGMHWNIQTDEFSYRALPEFDFSVITKRAVLQHISYFFDPLGLASPVTIRGKIFMQKIWLEKLDWDEFIGDDLSTQWKNLCTELNMLKYVKVSRFIGFDVCGSLELHCFCDASKVAYAAVAYLRQEYKNGVETQVIVAKTRVAPLKTKTVPKLELLAIAIGVRLCRFVEKSLRIPLAKKVIWSDSEIALSWIRNNKPFDVFVANRVRDITKYDAQFRHVLSENNPADGPSRGMPVSFLTENANWWNGPPWFSQPMDTWPSSIKQSHQNPDNSEIAQKTNVTLVHQPVLQSDSNSPIDIARFHSLNQLLRCTAICQVWPDVSKRRRNPKITSNDLGHAKQYWEKEVQKASFSDDLNRLVHGKTCRNPQLNLMIDDFGILRCRGRLERSVTLTDNEKSPKLLPSDHYYTQLVIKNIHQQLCHQGVRHTLTALRQEYWILRGRQTVQKTLSKCTVCRRWEGLPYASPRLPQLPYLRLAESPSFSYIGLDYAGPLFTKNNQKVWICLFTCAVTRAVHLELVEDLTTEQFLLCFRRYISRRGCPRIIVSDNAKTFKLANTTLVNIWSHFNADETVINNIAEKGIQWTFNADRAPWWGGFFERLIGMMKHCLRKSIGKSTLTNTELITQLTEIEAILNSRPLTFVYSNYDDGEPLTPNNLIGQRLPVGFPNCADENNDVEYLSKLSKNNSAAMLTRRMSYLQRITDQFWHIWRHEYLLHLREYNLTSKKPRGVLNPPNVDDIVIIKDQLPRAQWKLGRITELIPSKDGFIRAAKLIANRHQIIRPIQLLCPVEICTATPSCHPVEPDLTDNPVSSQTIHPPRRKAFLKAAELMKHCDNNDVNAAGMS